MTTGRAGRLQPWVLLIFILFPFSKARPGLHVATICGPGKPQGASLAKVPTAMSCVPLLKSTICLEDVYIRVLL